MRLDPDEMILFALLEEGNSFAHKGISDDYARLRFRSERAASKAATTAPRSLPSTRRTNQPNASSLSTNGSNPIICFEGPSACWLLTSMIAIRLSSLWCAADIIASHFEPSSSSPSENSV